MATTIYEGEAEITTNSLYDVGDFHIGARIRDVVQLHGAILPNPSTEHDGTPVSAKMTKIGRRM